MQIIYFSFNLLKISMCPAVISHNAHGNGHVGKA